MESGIEQIQLFMEYESDDMPVVYFYEVGSKDNRFALREMEVFADRSVKIENFQLRARQRAINLTGANPVCKGLASSRAAMRLSPEML